ncbi:MAG: glycerol-3-phosphate acyltransferase, partial [Pseudomonadales bacterium]|nr:glycerol-3-phosphate acyltransferase [Pseudomonadales bacterium]
WLLKDDYILAMMGFCAFLGHLFPIYFNFEGGKGVATALGVITTLSWPIGLAVMLIWLIVAILSRMSSLSALISWALAPLIVYLYLEQVFYPIAAISICLILRHHENIKKILTGTESRIGDKKNTEITS